jgi:hypothetical protein
MTSKSEVEAAFNTALKQIACPNCGLEYTDHAVSWCNGWIEGRHDLLLEMGRNERDGPIKLRCELCGAKAQINYFTSVATLISAEPEGA